MLYEASPAGVQFRSFSSLLSAISFDNQTGIMSGNDREPLWRGKILRYLDFLRDNETFRVNPEYQKQQYILLYIEIRKKLLEKIPKMTEEKYNEWLVGEKYKAIGFLEDYGFDVSYHSMTLSYSENAEQYKLDAEKAYHKFMATTSRTSDIIRDRVNRALEQDKRESIFISGSSDQEKKHSIKKSS